MRQIKHVDKQKLDLTWGNNVGQWAFWPFPNRGGVACRQVWVLPPPPPPPPLHLLLEWRASWVGGRPGRNGSGRADEEWGSRTHLHLNWPDEKQAGLTTPKTTNHNQKHKPAGRKDLDGNQREPRWNKHWAEEQWNWLPYSQIGLNYY